MEDFEWLRKKQARLVRAAKRAAKRAAAAAAVK
jgi:hypothetical protein